MGGGGLYVLVAYGGQNILLSGNPDFTFFYKTYKKYTHFSEESVTQPMDGPQELFNEQPIQVRLKIQRVADLVRDMYLVLTLPDIYCKWLDLNDPSNNRAFQYNFNWTRYIGCQMIQQVGLYIGGQKIQEFDGNYMIAKAQADLPIHPFKNGGDWWETCPNSTTLRQEFGQVVLRLRGIPSSIRIIQQGTSIARPFLAVIS